MTTRSVPDIDSIRAALDDRLAMLEAALADPGQHSSLEQIILDLARLATEEADAAARQAASDAERKGERAIDSLRQKLETVLHELETERSARASLDAELTAARQTLQQSEQALHQRDQLAQQREQLLQQIQQRDQALQRAEQAIQAERDAAAGRQQELAAAQQAVQQEQKARAADLRKLKDGEAVMAAARRELEQVRAALEAEKSASAKRASELAAAREALDQARSAAESQKGASAQHQRELAGLRQALEHAEAALQTERAARSGQIDGASAAQQALEQERAAHAAAKKQLEELRAALEGARTALDTERANSTQLREKFAKLEQDVKAVRKQAESRASDAGSQKELERLREELETTKQTFSARGAELQSIIDASESKIRSLELAVRDADERAIAAEHMLESQKKASAGAPAPAHHPPPPRPAVPSAPPPPAAHDGPVRATPRIAMASDVDIQVDGSPAKLIDLSMTGAQILASVVMKPNRQIKLILPLGDQTVTCKGKVVWARLEPKGGQIGYRAGVVFTAADPAALEKFLRAQG